ncbi:hypothetical protein D3C87_1776050 [compost metagenome]
MATMGETSMARLSPGAPRVKSNAATAAATNCIFMTASSLQKWAQKNGEPLHRLPVSLSGQAGFNAKVKTSV